jgi:hypothetical protein
MNRNKPTTKYITTAMLGNTFLHSSVWCNTTEAEMLDVIKHNPYEPIIKLEKVEGEAITVIWEDSNIDRSSLI